MRASRSNPRSGGSPRLPGATLEIHVRDTGPGLTGTSNLFVPFFSTKPGGSGIGLLLSRQIAEAHGGSLTLHDRDDGPGCEARVRLPTGAQPHVMADDIWPGAATKDPRSA